ncbi:MAG: aspartate kinase [Muribaculaceae bacterium]|nr:aspartate kinase [Muribaculaceae bacterium]
MKVLKFGGTSVGSIESLRHVKEIVESCPGQVMVVVSALGGVTNQLIEMTNMSIARDTHYEALLEQVRQRHLDVIAGVVPEPLQGQCNTIVEQFIDGNLRSFYSMLCLNTDLREADIMRIKDAIVAHGEIMSSAIVSCLIQDAEPHFSPNFIKTHLVDGRHILDADLTRQLIAKELGNCLAQRVVMQGFIADDADTGHKTNLGRGGSDYTAALVAAALDAESLEIWTDVDGFMTADPRTHPEATVIPEMTYAQAQQMCDAGAKVIYAPTLHPVAERHIPVWVKNTFNPSAPGTVIN